VFPLPKALGAAERFLERREVHIPLDEHLIVTCPHCGHRELAGERRYFGFMGPRATKSLIIAMILGAILIIGHDLIR
jgi:hypothetical protein